MLGRVKAQFLTNKYRLSHTGARAGVASKNRRSANTGCGSGLVNIYDFQLRDHVVNSSSLYAFECSCALHKHAKRVCRITTERLCLKCGQATRLLVPFQALLAHKFETRDLHSGGSRDDSALYTCCEHVHTERCGVCINCTTFVTGDSGRMQAPCLVEAGTRCSIIRESVCPHHPDRFATALVPRDALVGEHLYNLKSPSLFVCREHAHRHVSHPRIVCRVQGFRCCDKSVALHDYRSSFVMSVAQHSERANATPAKYAKFIMYDPTIWRDQSYNYFASFVRSIVLLSGSPSAASLQAIKERYQRFAKSNFVLSHLRSYISGKDSLCRIAVTGYETRGMYQTSTISCTMLYYEVRVPQGIYDLLLAEGFDLDIAMVKRDPSINTTCMYLCAVRRNPDPRALTIEIADSLAKGLHQDQDGDKNAVYFLRRRTPVRADASICWDNSRSYSYALARIELARAFGKRLTLLGHSRYSLSENSLVLLHRNPDLLRLPPNLSAAKPSPRYIIDALSGYHADVFDDVFAQIVAANSTLERHTFFTVHDLVERTDRLRSIHESGAKGSEQHVQGLMRNISSDKTLHECAGDMIAMHNKCIRSSQELSRNGRSQFASLYGASDAVLMGGLVLHNKRLVADYNGCGLLGPQLWSEASLDCFVRELFIG